MTIPIVSYMLSHTPHKSFLTDLFHSSSQLVCLGILRSLRLVLTMCKVNLLFLHTTPHHTAFWLLSVTALHDSSTASILTELDCSCFPQPSVLLLLFCVKQFFWLLDMDPGPPLALSHRPSQSSLLVISIFVSATNLQKHSTRGPTTTTGLRHQ